MDDQPPAPQAVPAGAKHIDIEAGLKTLAGAAGVVGTLVTVAIGFNTYLSGRNQVQIATQQRCIELSTAYIDLLKKAATEVDSGDAPSIQEANYKNLLFNHDLRQAVCKRAGFAQDLGLPSKTDLEQQLASPSPPDQGPAPVSVASASPPGPPQAAASAPNVAAPSPPAPPRPAGTPLRLFVQIHDESQLGNANALMQWLRTMNLDNHPLVVLGPEKVPSANENSLRCLKREDCKLVGRLAALISTQLAGANLQTLDLSGRYESAPMVKPGTFELWFGPGPIMLKPS